jgi:CheY-like chemotaxis protein
MKRSATDLTGLRVLLIDGKAHHRNLIRTMLSRSGVREIVAAECGEEAIQILQQPREQPFSCIVSDCYMEPVNGLQLLQKIRAGRVDGVEPDICFILLSRFADAGLVNVAINLDANAYVLKPLSTEKLTNSVARGLARSWRLQSPKYYAAIEGLETPPELVDLSLKYFGSTRLAEPITGLDDGNDFSLDGTRTVRLKKTGVAESQQQDFQNIPNLHLSLVEDIQEDDILAQDIRDTHGNLLISGGTILDERAVERLLDIAGDSGEHVKLWIGREYPKNEYLLADQERVSAAALENAMAAEATFLS